jgi:hypothetical protein
MERFSFTSNSGGVIGTNGLRPTQKDSHPFTPTLYPHPPSHSDTPLPLRSVATLPPLIPSRTIQMKKENPTHQEQSDYATSATRPTHTHQHITRRSGHRLSLPRADSLLLSAVSFPSLCQLFYEFHSSVHGSCSSVNSILPDFLLSL